LISFEIFMQLPMHSAKVITGKQLPDSCEKPVSINMNE